MFERSLEICPGNPAYQYLMAKHLEQTNRPDQAAHYYQQAGELGPYDRDYVRRVHLRCGIYESQASAEQ